jgi:hypothetical protein
MMGGPSKQNPFAKVKRPRRRNLTKEKSKDADEKTLCEVEISKEQDIDGDTLSVGEHGEEQGLEKKNST